MYVPFHAASQKSLWKTFQIIEVAFKLFENDENSLFFLRDCLMATINEVQLVECEGKKKWNFVHKLLERTVISHLEVDYSTLTNESL